MSRLKIVIVLVFMIFGLQSVSAQLYKFQTTGFSVMEKDAKGKWGKWSKLQKAEIVVTLDTDKNRLLVYSQEIQLYKILKYREKEENDNDIVHAFDCQDENGEEFTISIITRKKQSNRKQLYINQKNVIIVYNVVTVP